MEKELVINCINESIRLEKSRQASTDMMFNVPFRDILKNIRKKKEE